ncbi:MAG: HAMP domain-containing histidine kinase [Maledivibacter sp.]|nr:HAMP domain-containing histidine kinase [Maledivibacter sp.]
MKIRIKFRWKIFILTISIYIISLGVIGVIITENNYHRSLRNEIRQALREEENINDTATLYIRINQQLGNKKMNIERYSSRLIDMFKLENTDIAIFNQQLALKSSTISIKQDLIQDGLMEAVKGKKNYILKWIDNKHYLLITDYIVIEEEKLILTFLQDISDIDVQRQDQYRFFTTVGMVGLIIVAIVTRAMGKIIIRPIANLKMASREIASGNYHDRLRINDNDEIGQLGVQFNIMADEIEKKVNELREEAERKQKFIDNLTHELRTPLTSIIGYSDTLMNIKYDEKVFYRALSFINMEGNRMIKMVNQLMNLILLRKDTFDMKEEDLKVVLEDVEKVLAGKAESRNMNIKIIGENIKRKINRDLFKGMIINLLDNAINASKAGDEIIIGIESNSDYDMIFVKDTGIGMDTKHIRKVIQPYYRVDRSRSRKSGGAGLGLSLCNEIIKVHGGKIDIDSTKGRGTTVNIIFYKSVTS